jgi:Uncharacterized protein conserved in bacteria (DUF2330)
MRGRLSVLALLAAAGLMVAAAPPASACGGLVAPDGAVRLDNTTTLAAYHDGVERYVTSFQYAGGVANFGEIVPLPGVPTAVTRAGSWTLQRLEKEVHPPEFDAAASGKIEAASAAPAQVLLQTTVDALDITVLKGGGAAVTTWIRAHGYFVSNDAPAMLDFYARRSPIFLAARFDASKAQALGQQEGDGTPVEITIPTAEPWVPLHILALAKIPQAIVTADVFLLTDKDPSLLGLDPGVQVEASEPASASLLSDLRSDKNSQWVPSAAWLTYIQLDSPAGLLNHDLAIDPTGAGRPSAIEAGYEAPAAPPHAAVAGFQPVAAPSTSRGGGVAALYAAAFALFLVLLLVGWTFASGSRRHPTLRP